MRERTMLEDRLGSLAKIERDLEDAGEPRSRESPL
jgi:hypothetical protein